MRIPALTLLLLSLLHFAVNAQNDNTVVKALVARVGASSATHPKENIYIHLNKPRYNRSDTIWFKLYTVTGNHQLSAISGVAYAELVSPNDTLIQCLTLKLEAGMASGDFALPITLFPGKYRIRAYTNWMKNDGEESFYNREVIIGSQMVTDAPI